MSREDIPITQRGGLAARHKMVFCRFTYKQKKVLKTMKLMKMECIEKSTFLQK